MRRARGYSLIELTVAMAVTMTVTASVFSVMNPAQGNFVSQPETADMQQRLRVVSDTLGRDLIMAGGGAYQGGMSGSLVRGFAPVLPYRAGTADDDPPGSFKSDTISVMYVPDTAAQTTLATGGPSEGSSDIGVNIDPGCPPAQTNQVCGFSPGMRVLMYDDSGNHDAFTVTSVGSQTLSLQQAQGSPTFTGYRAGSTKLVQVRIAVYYLKSDTASGLYQLIANGGGASPDTPIADNVVGLAFEYYGEPSPPQLLRPGVDQSVSYGPEPPALETTAPGGASYGNGGNCTFQVAGGTQIPRLADLAGGNPPGLVRLTAAQLTDGPWCPDPSSANRWDADLVRIRTIGVTIRVQAALAALRGPASLLFAHAGTSTSGSKWVPDQEIRFQVTPRNLNLAR